MPGHDNVYFESDDELMAPSPMSASAEPAAARPAQDPYDMGLVDRPLQRMYIVDLRSLNAANGEKDGGGALAEHRLTAQFNPTELEEQWKVIWSRMDSPGLSHRPLQYMGTENSTFGFSLVFDARAKRGGIEEIMRARRFLTSLCVPRRGATSVREGEAPRVFFIWPNFVTLTAVVTELSFKYELFDSSGTPLRYTVGVKLESVDDVRFYSEDLRE